MSARDGNVFSVTVRALSFLLMTHNAVDVQCVIGRPPHL